jgi:hypothetical protein
MASIKEKHVLSLRDLVGAILLLGLLILHLFTAVLFARACSPTVGILYGFLYPILYLLLVYFFAFLRKKTRPKNSNIESKQVIEQDQKSLENSQNYEHEGTLTESEISNRALLLTPIPNVLTKINQCLLKMEGKLVEIPNNVVSFYIATAIIWLIFSDSICSPTMGTMFVLVMAIFQAIKMPITLLIALLRKKTQRPKMAFNLLGIFILLIGFDKGVDIFWTRMEETGTIADQIIEEIKVYHQKNGFYPSELSQIATPQPAVKYSEFYYRLDKESEFILGIHLGWSKCERSLQKEWVCDD